MTSVLLIVTGAGVQRYVRTYVESGIIGVYVSIVLVYALILFGGGGGGGGGCYCLSLFTMGMLIVLTHKISSLATLITSRFGKVAEGRYSYNHQSFVFEED